MPADALATGADGYDPDTISVCLAQRRDHGAPWPFDDREQRLVGPGAVDAGPVITSAPAAPTSTRAELRVTAASAPPTGGHAPRLGRERHAVVADGHHARSRRRVP